MARDTNTSKCLGTVSGCERYGSVVCVKRYLTSYGFRLQYDVDLTGFKLSKEQLRTVSSSVTNFMKSLLNKYASIRALDDIQLELF